MVDIKYFQLSLYHDFKVYQKDYNVYQTLNLVYFKLYRDLQSLPIPIYYQKKLFIDFVSYLLFLLKEKSQSYDLILVIVDSLIYMIYQKAFITTINPIDEAKIILDVMERYYDLSKSVISDSRLLFISKFWCLL